MLRKVIKCSILWDIVTNEYKSSKSVIIATNIRTTMKQSPHQPSLNQLLVDVATFRLETKSGDCVYPIGLLPLLSLHAICSTYLSKLFERSSTVERLSLLLSRLSSHLIVPPPLKMVGFGDRSFRRWGPALWNSLRH